MRAALRASFLLLALRQLHAQSPFPLRFPETHDHSGVDQHGEAVFELPPAPRTPYGTSGHQRRGLSVVQVSPKGADASGNITVLVLGTAFRDFGARTFSAPICPALPANSNPTPFCPRFQVMLGADLVQ